MELHIGNKTDVWSSGPFIVNGLMHTSLVGESGTGKSVVLGDMVIQDIRAGHAVVLMDPHDEVGNRVLNHIPKHLLEKVKVFDPHSGKVLGLVVLDAPTIEERLRRSDQFIDTISKIYGENSWGGQSAYIARNLLYAICEVEEHPNPKHLFLALMSEDYRKHLFARVKSENLRMFAKKFDEEWRDTDRENRAAAPTNKSDIAIANPLIRDVLCQADGLDFAEAFEKGWIVICLIGKGRLGPEAMRLFGAFLLQECLFAGLGRASVKPADRKPVRIYVDEFHNFVGSNDAADYMLAELRKYGVSLVAASQQTKDMPAANFYTRIFGRLDAESAKEAAQILSRDVSDFLTRMPNRSWWAQTVKDGVKTDAFIQGLEMLKRLGTEYPAWRVKRHSEENNGRRREDVEREINAFLKGGNRADVSGSAKSSKRGKRGNRSNSRRAA